MKTRGLLIAALLSATACLDDPEMVVEAEYDEFEIIGGIEDSGHPAVAMIQTSTGGCTATLVAPRVLLTAGHCVINSIEANQHGGRTYFGPGGSGGFTDQRTISRLAAHRFYQTFQFYDIAMVRLSSDAPAEIEPMAFQLDPLPDDMLGEIVTVVGFGVDDGVAQTGFGTKRRIDLEITSYGQHHIGFGEPGRNICQGDSGGPTFRDNFPEGQVAIAVSSYGANDCMAESKVARTDTYADWLIEVFDAWSGPCQHDGVCVEEGCRTPDPDCDACGFDGFCADDCAKPDLDCPLGGLAGDTCTDDFDCEHRTCVEAIEDPRVKYCSEPCDPAIPGGEQCDAPLSVCSDQAADGFVCRYRDITPGVQGAPCLDGSECRSGACDPDHDICVERCGDGLPECADGYECVDVGGGTRACTIPGDGGCGCRAGGRAGAGAPIALLLGVLVLAIRRLRAAA